MKIHHEGYRIIPLIVAFLAAIIILAYLLAGPVVYTIILIVVLVFLGLVVWFFRDPQTVKNAEPGEVLSVADGQIVVIGPAFEKEYFQEERLQVSTFMSVFNVHINHIPIEGEIVYQKYHPGKYLIASLPKSSELNERCTTVIRTSDGKEILVRQIAGLLARRIATYKKTGEKVTLADHLGFIRFGSRVDVFFPIGTDVKVKMDQRVKGGLTVLGKL